MLSEQLELFKAYSIKMKKPIEITMTPKLAEELLSLRPKTSRPLSQERVWFWAFIYVSGLSATEVGFDKEWNTIEIENKSNCLIDGAHRLAGFIISGVKNCGMNLHFSELGASKFITPNMALDLLNKNPSRKINKKLVNAIAKRLLNPVIHPSSLIKSHSPKRYRK